MRAQPLAIVPPVRRAWALWLAFSWPGAERFGPLAWFVKRPLKRMRFIHFAHWGLVHEVGGQRLPTPHILFTTNFNGDVNAYIDAFSILIPWRMRAMWQGAIGFPGPEPLGRFRAFIFSGVEPNRHFWCAYPDASVKEVLAALSVQEQLAELRAFDGSDAAFAARWERFLAEHGNDL